MITTIWGLPRAGKTTALAWVALQAQRGRPARIGAPFHRVTLGEFAPYDRVYSNFPLKGCYQLNPTDLGRYDFSRSLILCDESSLVFYSREYKNNDRTALDWLCLHGHYRCDLVFASQGLQDCDKRIRNLTAQLVHVRKVGGFSILTPVSKDELPDDPTKEVYIKGGLLRCKPLRRKKFYDMFDSFDAPPLPENPAKLWFT